MNKRIICAIITIIMLLSCVPTLAENANTVTLTFDAGAGSFGDTNVKTLTASKETYVTESEPIPTAPEGLYFYRWIERGTEDSYYSPYGNSYLYDGFNSDVTFDAVYLNKKPVDFIEAIGFFVPNESNSVSNLTDAISVVPNPNYSFDSANVYLENSGSGMYSPITSGNFVNGNVYRLEMTFKANNNIFAYYLDGTVNGTRAYTSCYSWISNEYASIEIVFTPGGDMNTHTIHFDSNGVGATPSDTQTNADCKISLPSLPDLGDYKFAGWRDSAGRMVSENTLFFTEQTLTAVYAINNIELSLFVTPKIGQTVEDFTENVKNTVKESSMYEITSVFVQLSTDSIETPAKTNEYEFEVSGTYRIIIDVEAKNGYQFSDNLDASEIININNGKFDDFTGIPSSSLQSYTIIVETAAKNAVTVSFDANEGTGEMDEYSLVEDFEFYLPTCDFNPPEGYHFDYWIDDTFNGKRYDVGAKVVVKKDMTFYPHWSKGTVSPTPTTLPTNTDPATTPNADSTGEIVIGATSAPSEANGGSPGWIFIIIGVIAVAIVIIIMVSKKKKK